MTKLPHQVVEERNRHGRSHRFVIRQYSASLRAVLHRAVDGYLHDADDWLGPESAATCNHRRRAGRRNGRQQAHQQLSSILLSGELVDGRSRAYPS